MCQRYLALSWILNIWNRDRKLLENHSIVHVQALYILKSKVRNRGKGKQDGNKESIIIHLCISYVKGIVSKIICRYIHTYTCVRTHIHHSIFKNTPLGYSSNKWMTKWTDDANCPCGKWLEKPAKGSEKLKNKQKQREGRGRSIPGSGKRYTREEQDFGEVWGRS